MMIMNTMKSSRKMSSMVSQAIRPTTKYILRPWWLHHYLNVSSRSTSYDSSVADMLIEREVEILSDGERRSSEQQRCERQRVRVPRGSLAVYVGPEERRYVIPTRYLSMPEFGDMMERKAEEFGYDQQDGGGLRIPNCQEADFEKMILLAKVALKS